MKRRMKRRMKRLIVCLSLLAALGLTQPAWGCPNCRESVESPVEGRTQIEARERAALAAGFNAAIYVMLGGAGVAMGLLGACLYLGVSRPVSGTAE